MNLKTYIILVNWNGWQDTLECLESIFQQTEKEFCIIVCDNGSTDGSLDKIQQWATGEIRHRVLKSSMEQFSYPPQPKPVAFQLLNRAQAGHNNTLAEQQLILIDCGENLGFAGGNNIGLKFAMSQKEMAWCWLLNNDTVIEQDALSSLTQKMQSDSKIGIAGSTIIYYNQRNKVQAFGGARYFTCIGLSMHIGRFKNQLQVVDERKIEKQMSYVMGASMFVTRKLLDTIGLMSEDYFLYYEELDWAIRSRKKFTLGYASKSLVFHKAGASIGSSNKSSQRSMLADYYLMSNRLKVTDKFFPRCKYTVRLFLLVEMLVRLLKGQQKKAVVIWRLFSGKLEHGPNHNE